MLKQLYALVVRDELIERSTQFEEEAHLTHFSPVGKNTKLTSVEKCIFIELVARTH